MKDTITANETKVKEYLTEWAEWMKADNTKLGYPSKSLMLSSGGASTSFEDMCEVLDNTISKAIDAILEGVTISQRLAVHHYHLGAVWRSSRSNIIDDYADALMAIEFGLRRRGLM